MTMPITSIARLRGVRQCTNPEASWAKMSIIDSPKARNRKENVGCAIERRNATRYRNIGYAQKQNSAEDRHRRAGAPDGAVRAITADIHEGREEEECAEDETKQRHKHGIDRHQDNAADQQLWMNGLFLFLIRLSVERLHKSAGVLI